MKLLHSIVHYAKLLPNTGSSTLLLDVTFLRDFGPWVKDEYVQKLVVDYANARMTDNKQRSCEIRLTKLDLTPLPPEMD